VKIRRRGGTGILVDNSWSFGGGGALRGWQRHGEGIEISEDGKLVRSAFALEYVFAGPMGLGRSKEGRLYQSVDHGASWVEVATPPGGVESSDLVACSSAGCDLGAFYRIGWTEQPPSREPAKTPAPPAPSLRRVRAPELTCRPSGVVGSKVLPRTTDSPEDLGLGMSRLSIANEKNEWTFIRNTVARTLVSPIHDVPDNGDGTPSLRAAFSGFGTSQDGGTLSVAGPNKNILALRRAFSYAPPFDPLGRIVRTGIAMGDVVAAGRRAGMSTDEILTDDPTENGSIVTLTPSDPTAPSDVAVHNVERGLLSIVRADRVRTAFHTTQSGGTVVSGVALPGAADEMAFLEVASGGVGHVFKVGAGGAADLFDVNPTGDESYYPANPDALAVGPKGELAILRTPSGGEPASALDPAFLIVPATPPSALSPWSELKLADDPACRSEPGGYRATIQAIGPWIRVTTPELRVAEDAPMLARVRWSPKRVCLEGFEVKLPNVPLKVPGNGGDQITLATWLVAKGSTFARVAVAEGIEWRQPLECSLVASGAP
jgi:hypothetical protein